MSPDIEKYRRHLDGHALSNDDKDELVRALWLVMESFVDRAFDLSTAQAPVMPAKDASRTCLVVEFEKKSRNRFGLAHPFTAPCDGVGKRKAT